MKCVVSKGSIGWKSSPGFSFCGPWPWSFRLRCLIICWKCFQVLSFTSKIIVRPFRPRNQLFLRFWSLIYSHWNILCDAPVNPVFRQSTASGQTCARRSPFSLSAYFADLGWPFPTVVRYHFLRIFPLQIPVSEIQTCSVKSFCNFCRSWCAKALTLLGSPLQFSWK